jgi:hypothetical protein
MNSIREHDWVAPENTRLPDFIICGAMKSGTSTVHSLLHKHPNVYIPDPEIHFFDIDDIFQHTDFYFQEDTEWIYPDISKNPKKYWKWYTSFFDDAPENCLIGEDSTCYLPSTKAASRIALQSKPIKTIICLRHPTQRAYSQYWHMLRTGRAIFNFEDTIKFTPNYVLERSMYLTQVQEFMKHIPRERIFFFILEEFLADKETTIKKLADFLSLDYDDFPEGVLETHANRAKIPISVTLQAYKNRMLRGFGNVRYKSSLPFSENVKKKRSIVSGFFNILHSILNPRIPRKAPKMDAATKDFLDKFFQRELEGLGDIIGKDLDKIWFREISKESKRSGCDRE